jgi:hypothetical protein
MNIFWSLKTPLKDVKITSDPLLYDNATQKELFTDKNCKLNNFQICRTEWIGDYF